MSQFVELEIQTYLRTNEPGKVFEQINKWFQENPHHLFDASATRSFALFLFNSGLYEQLKLFCLENLHQESFSCPWDLLLAALDLGQFSASEKFLPLLMHLQKDYNLVEIFGRYWQGHQLIPQISELHHHYREKNQRDFLNSKRLLLEQVQTLRIQGLEEKEKELLEKLLRLFPNDSDILKKSEEIRQRSALEILEKYSHRLQRQRTTRPVEEDTEGAEGKKILLKEIEKISSENPNSRYDMAILALSLEDYELGLKLLENADSSEEILWLKQEFLLKSHRFVEILSDLVFIENNFANNPETFFATAYLRAQALWGLGQKNTAIEVMEGLLAARPNYRSGNSLLEEWRNQ
ncbi:MAG: hypothetical protein ACLGGX_03955 [Bdellovibrionia bacterium]